MRSPAWSLQLIRYFPDHIVLILLFQPNGSSSLAPLPHQPVAASSISLVLKSSDHVLFGRRLNAHEHLFFIESRLRRGFDISHEMRTSGPLIVLNALPSAWLCLTVIGSQGSAMTFRRLDPVPCSQECNCDAAISESVVQSVLLRASITPRSYFTCHWRVFFLVYRSL
mgnify:CR=1 FL=1